MGLNSLFYLVVAVIFGLISCQSQSGTMYSGHNSQDIHSDTSVHALGSPKDSIDSNLPLDKFAKPITVDELLMRFHEQSDTVMIYNFWATWCKPCIEEMPHFEALGQKFADKKLKVVFVSLDFIKDLEKRVNPFLSRKGINSEVLILDGGNDPNKWIDRIEPQWSGAIPATIILRTSDNYRGFFEREFTYEELEALISPLL